MKSTCKWSSVARLLLLITILARNPATTAAQEPNATSPLSVNAAKTLLAEKGTELSDADLARVCSANNLTELDLTGCGRLTDQACLQIAQLKQLKSLRLARCYRLTVNGLRSISSLPKLKSLDISSLRTPLPEVYRELVALPSLVKLEVRDVRGFKSDGLELLDKLKHLDISNATGGIKDDDLAPVAKLTSLTHLNVNGSRQWSANRNLTDKGLKHLESLESL